MELKMNVLVVAAAIVASVNSISIDSVFRDGVQPYCDERCPDGFEYVESLGNCYQLLLDLGPVAQDKGVLACGMLQGSTLPTFQQKGDEDLLREYFWNKYQDQIKASKGVTPQAGFWTAYVRKAADGYSDIENDYFVTEYVNLYSGNPINPELWAHGQPNNDNLDQTCVARKRIQKEYINKKEPEDILKMQNGLDDYQCAYPHWVICSLSRSYALNKRAYNTAIMAGVQNDGGDCEIGWKDQTKYQFMMMIQNARLQENDKDADRYEEVEPNIQDPNFKDICKADFNYQCN